MKRISYCGNPPAIETNPKLPVLVSFEYVRKGGDRALSFITEQAPASGYELLLDSGAFSAFNSGQEITIDEYADFLSVYQSKFFAYFALDVIGDKAGTEQNLAHLWGKGFEPAPVHILGEEQKEMDALFEKSSLVGLGGFKRPKRGKAPLSYIHQKMRWAKGRHVHWLGYTSQQDLLALTPYSCDASSWCRGAMYGLLDIYLGNGRWATCKRHEQGKFDYTAEVNRVIEAAGFTKRDFYDDRNWHKDTPNGYVGEGLMVLMVPALSWINYVMDLRKRIGTRLFLVLTMARQETEALAAAWEIWKNQNYKR